MPHCPSRAGQKRHDSVCKRRLWSILCWIIIAFIWLDTVRTGTVFKSGISATSSDFTLLSYIVFQASCGYIMLVSYKFGMKNHELLVKGLNEYHGQYGCQLNLHKLTRISRATAVVAVILDVCFSTIDLIPTYISSVPVDSFSKRRLTHINFSLQNPSFHVYSLVSWIGRILGTSFMFSLPLHYIISAYIFSKEYAAITNAIKSIAAAPPKDTNNTFERLRIRFEKLTETFNSFNGVVSHYVFVAYISSVCNTCFFLYTAINGKVPGYDMYVYMFLMVNSLVQLVGITATASWIHVKIHEPLETLIKINTEHLDSPTIQRISLFVSRLYGSKIGISVYGMFVIDSSTFIMLFGTILTYFIVVFEMRPKGSV